MITDQSVCLVQHWPPFTSIMVLTTGFATGKPVEFFKRI